jgi:aspartyl-tRNA(Asn)/glutamyl-tRNA(Gln) amidotransferase subunit A
MAAYACGATSQNEFIGECLNPLDGKTVVGGSSSGSAVAVARGLCYASLGTDTAGSIRMPAASCGLVGLKTTQGLLSTVGVAPLAPQLDSVGIVARSALDLEMVLREIVGHNTPQVAAQGFTLKAPRELSQIHCWLPSASMDDGVAQEVLECMKKLPNTSIDEQFSDEASLSASAELMLYHQAALTHHSKLLSSSSNPMESSMGTAMGLTTLPQGLVEMVRLGLAAPVSWVKEVLAQRSVWRQRFEAQFFQSHDLLVVPCIGIELPLASQVRVGSIDFDARKLLQLHRFMGWVNYLGLPSLSLPIGKDSKGMPISIQVLCRPYEELSLLHWAQHFIGSRLGTQNVRQHFPFFV